MKFRLHNISVYKAIKLALFVFAAYYLIIYLWMVYYRIQYPFELEWIEGGLVDQVQRIVSGEPIYVAPSVNFVPFIYPPLYFYLSTIASHLFGDGFFPLRFVSFTASLVSFLVIFLIVYDETKNSWAAFLSTSLFAAAFRVTGAWLDVARVDSLFLALWLLFIYFVRHNNDLKHVVLAGLWAALAFLTKQTALIICIPVWIYMFLRNRRFALASLTTAVLIVGIVTWILYQASAGWYTYYIFGLLSQQMVWIWTAFISFWKDDLLIHLPIAILFVAFYFMKKTNGERFHFAQWAFILIGALAGTFLTRVKIGGYDNVLLPMYVVISILFGLGAGELFKITNQPSDQNRTHIELIIHIACLIQFIILFYNPLAQIPTRADINAGNELLEFISSIDGEVYLPDHGYIPTLAGKRTYANHSPVSDVRRGKQQANGKTILVESLNNAIQTQMFDIIILDSGWNFCCTEIDKYYTKKDVEIFTGSNDFYPVTGHRRRPTIVYIANHLLK